LQTLSPKTVEITGTDSVHAVAQILADEYSRKILASALHDPKSVEELSKENAIPLSTCYRRVHEMLREGIVVVERIMITQDGKRYELFRSGFTSLTLRLEGNLMSVVGAVNEEVAEKVSSNFFTMKWTSTWAGEGAPAQHPAHKVREPLSDLR
jgi:predicted transcriptional regulator